MSRSRSSVSTLTPTASSAAAMRASISSCRTRAPAGARLERQVARAEAARALREDQQLSARRQMLERFPECSGVIRLDAALPVLVAPHGDARKEQAPGKPAIPLRGNDELGPPRDAQIRGAVQDAVAVQADVEHRPAARQPFRTH